MTTAVADAPTQPLAPPNPAAAPAPARRAEIFPLPAWFAMGGLVCFWIAVAVVEKRSFKNFAAHDAGRVYRSAWLSGPEVRNVVERFGVKTVVNLCMVDEDPARLVEEEKALAQTAARRYLVPFPMNHTSNVDHPGIAAFEKILADPANYPMLVHCYHGRERTAKALAMYDISQRGMSAAQSIGAMQAFAAGGQTEPVVRFSQNYEAYTQRTAKDRPAALAAHPAPRR